MMCVLCALCRNAADGISRDLKARLLGQVKRASKEWTKVNYPVWARSSVGRRAKSGSNKALQ